MPVRCTPFGPAWSARIAAAILVLPTCALAQDAAPAEAPRYSAEVEAKVAELMQKAGETKAQLETAQMTREIASIAKITGLDEAGRKKLEAAAPAAVETAIKDWKVKMDLFFRANWGPDVQLAVAQTWLVQATTFARSGYGAEYTRASMQPSWKNAVSAALDAKQAAAWDAEIAEQTRKFNEETKAVIATSRQRYLDQFSLAISAKVSEIQGSLSLDEERSKKLEKIGTAAAEKSADLTTLRVRRVLEGYEPAARKQAIKSNSVYVSPLESESAEKQSAWKDGLKEILSAEEIQRWQTAVNQRTERRIEQFAHMLVWAMDQKVAFTASQREQIRPLASQWVREKKANFPERRTTSYASYSLESFCRVAAVAKDEDLKKILDEKQIARWKEATQREVSMSQIAAARLMAAGVQEKEGVKRTAFEPEEMENAISDFVAKLSEHEQRTAISKFVLQAEEAIRVASLDGKTAQRLLTAARGAAEVDLDSWRTNTVSQIRGQLQGATPNDFQQRLENTGFASADRRTRGTLDEKEGFWAKAIANELTDAQRAAWKKETDARDADEDRTVVVTLVGEVDRLCLLTDEQRGKLEPLVSALVKDYGEDIARMFANNNGGWFLMGYYVLTPIAGLGDKQLKQILSESQWKVLSGSQQYSNGLRYWENIASSHKERMKEREKK